MNLSDSKPLIIALHSRCRYMSTQVYYRLDRQPPWRSLLEFQKKIYIVYFNNFHKKTYDLTLEHLFGIIWQMKWDIIKAKVNMWIRMKIKSRFKWNVLVRWKSATKAAYVLEIVNTKWNETMIIIIIIIIISFIIIIIVTIIWTFELIHIRIALAFSV